MAVKHRSLFLYLALACFLGIILIFIFDGYMGVYDRLSTTANEFPQVIEADQWSQQERYGYLPSVSTGRGEKATFSYEIDNRLFSAYAADVEVSAWHSQNKVGDLITQPVSIPSFGKGTVAWALDTAQLVPVDTPLEQSYDFTIIIKRGAIERRVIVYVNPVPYPPKSVIIQPPR